VRTLETDVLARDWRTLRVTDRFGAALAFGWEQSRGRVGPAPETPEEVPMIGRVIAAVVALSLSLTATAHAATLFAGPLHPEHEEEALQCSITNIHTQAQNVTMEIYGHDGTLVDSFAFALAPLATESFWHQSLFPFLPRVCKFTVPYKSLVRAVACVRSNDSHQRTCVPAE
jgi:hypothetical protein